MNLKLILLKDLSIFTILKFSILLVLSSKACAAGYDKPQVANPVPPPTSEISTNPERSSSEAKPRPESDQKKWRQTYKSGQNICKDNDGNVICLSRDMAQRAMWILP